MRLVCEATLTIRPIAFDQSHLNQFLSATITTANTNAIVTIIVIWSKYL